MEEVLGENSSPSAEDQSAVRHFEDTHFREADGHYVVCLSLKNSHLQLGKSCGMALQRYLSNEIELLHPMLVAELSNPIAMIFN